MKKISVDQIRKLREKTGAPMLRVKKVLEEVNGNEKKAKIILEKEGHKVVAKKAERKTSQGLLEAYVHHSGKVASLVEVLCETDFVARNDVFKQLAHNLALQVASMNAKNAQELQNQEFIKDPSKNISDLLKEAIVKTGENIRIGRIYRVELGQTAKS